MNPSALQTLVISMIRSPERRERARQELAKTHFQWDFLDAVDGKLLQFPIPEYSAKKVQRLLGYQMMPGELGAFLSHKKCWQACIDKNQTTLVFEDDFILLPQFEKVVKYLLEDYQDWELMRLQALVDSSHTVLEQTEDFAVVRNHQDPLGCTAYLIKPSAAKKLLDHSQSIHEPIDHYMEHIQKHGVRFLSIYPYPSDISQEPTTVYRPDRRPIRGMKKYLRSMNRWLDRQFAKDPWYPK